MSEREAAAAGGIAQRATRRRETDTDEGGLWRTAGTGAAHHSAGAGGADRRFCHFAHAALRRGPGHPRQPDGLRRRHGDFVGRSLWFRPERHASLRSDQHCFLHVNVKLCRLQGWRLFAAVFGILPKTSFAGIVTFRLPFLELALSFVPYNHPSTRV